MSDSEEEYSFNDIDNKPQHQINYEILLDKIILEKPQNKLVFPKAILSHSPTKTYIENFQQICDHIKREPNLFINFIKEEINCEVTMVNDKIIIHMKFPEKKFNSIYSKFIKKFVVCNSCGSSNTNVFKNQRLLINECNDCRSRFTIN